MSIFNPFGTSYVGAAAATTGSRPLQLAPRPASGSILSGLKLAPPVISVDTSGNAALGPVAAPGMQLPFGLPPIALLAGAGLVLYFLVFRKR